MYLKPVRIYYKVSETLTLIYEFVWSSTWGDNCKLIYSSYYESRRNDESDVWGHLWGDTFHSTMLKEQKAFCDLHDYYDDSWDYSELDVAYYAITEKYDPYKQFINTGQHYLSSKQKDLPEIDPNVDIEQEIKKHLYKWVDDVNIVVK